MSLELVSVITTDNLELPGLLYEPTEQTVAVVWLHGMGDTGVFYNPERINQLGKALVAKNIALLAFNNRGAHNSKTIRVIDETLPEDDRGYTGGTHFERIADCVHDINGAVALLRSRGYDQLYLAGHSTGANKVCAYNARTEKTPFSKYVLAGPGDDSGLFYNELGDKKFWKALVQAKSAVNAGKALSTMPMYSGMFPFSAQAAADILNPDGDYNTFPFYEATTKRLGRKPLFKEFGQIAIPTLIIFGDTDEYAYTAGGVQQALELFKQYANPQLKNLFSYQTVQDSDHSFHNREQDFAHRVAAWLSQ